MVSLFLGLSLNLLYFVCVNNDARNNDAVSVVDTNFHLFVVRLRIKIKMTLLGSG